MNKRIDIFAMHASDATKVEGIAGKIMRGEWPKKVEPTPEPRETIRERVAERRVEVLNLAKANASYQEIAEKLSIPIHIARSDVGRLNKCGHNLLTPGKAMADDVRKRRKSVAALQETGLSTSAIAGLLETTSRIILGDIRANERLAGVKK